MTGDSVWPFNTAIVCQQHTIKWPEWARTGKPQLSPGARSWQQLSKLGDSCDNVSEGRSLTHSPSPRLCHFEHPSACGTLGENKGDVGARGQHPVKQYAPGSYTVTISLFHFSSSANGSIIWAPAAFLEGAKRRKKRRKKKERRLVNFKASSHFSGYVWETLSVFLIVRANRSGSLRYGLNEPAWMF